MTRAIQAPPHSRTVAGAIQKHLTTVVVVGLISNAERRASPAGWGRAGTAFIKGMLELEYECELKGGDAVARELIQPAVMQAARVDG